MFYVKLNDFLKIIENSAKPSSVLDIDTRIDLLKNYYDKVNLSDEEVQSVKEQLRSVLKRENIGKLQSSLKVFLKKNEYIISHSLLSTFLSFKILMKHEMYNTKRLEKFFLSYFFHDLNITEIEMNNEREKYYIAKHDNRKELERLGKDNADLIENIDKLDDQVFGRLSLEQKIFAVSHLMANLIICKNLSLKAIESSKDVSDNYGDTLLDFIKLSINN